MIDERCFPGRQGRLLFAYLVAEHGTPVPRDELAEVLWGETPPATWDKALRVLISKLRGLLSDNGIDGASALAAAFGCYRLELPEGSWVDVLAASDAAQDAEAALATSELESARTAAALAESLVRQPFLPGEEGAWVEEKRRELTELRVRALDVLADAHLRSGDAREAAKWAKQVVALEPFRESGHRRLMEAHAAAGNRAEALRVYERCRRLVAEQLGTYPSPETESIYRALLEAPSPAAAHAGPLSGQANDEERPDEIPANRGRSPNRRRQLAVVLAAVGVGAIALSVLVLVTRRGTSHRALTVAADSVAVIDASSNRIVGDIPLGGAPGGISAGAGAIWVADNDDGTLLRIDPASARIARSIGVGPRPRSVTAGGGSIWVASASRLVRVDPRFDRVLGQTALRQVIRGFPPNAWGYGTISAAASGGAGIWVAHGVSAISQIDPRTGFVRRNVILDDAPLSLAVGKDTLWVTAAGSGALVAIDPTTASVVARIPIRREISSSPTDRGDVWAGVALADSSVWTPSVDHVWRIDPLTDAVVAKIPTGTGALGVAVDGKDVWVANYLAGTVSRIDSRTDKVVATIKTGQNPTQLAIARNRVWVTVN